MNPAEMERALLHSDANFQLNLRPSSGATLGIVTGSRILSININSLSFNLVSVGASYL